MLHRLIHSGRRLTIPATLLLLGCGGRSTMDRSTHQGEDATGEPISSSSSSLVIHGSRAEAQLERAKSQAREGRFDEAIRELRALYQDKGNPEPLRAEALLRWAEAEGSLLNAGRDLDAAIDHLELFLDQFPGSPLRRDAEQALERLRARRDATGAADGDAGE